MLAKTIQSSFWLLLAAFFLPLGIAAQDIKVTLLGTGCPEPVMNRFGPSILVQAGERKFIFDVGRGAMQRLQQAGINFKDIDGVFLTHLHSDHVVGFPDLWLTGWVVGRRDRPLPVWGPRGTSDMMRHLTEAYAFDVAVRTNAKASPAGAALAAKDISEGVVYDAGGIKITAFNVDHGLVAPAFGYRIDYHGRSVVLSGDTRPSPNLVKFAKGVDLLIYEVAAPESFRHSGMPDAQIKAILGYHTTPEQAGEIFKQLSPKLAVYSHIVLPTATEDDLIPQTRKTYSGPLVLGEDLMVITVGERTAVEKKGQ